MASSQTNSPFYSPQGLYQSLAAKLADACVNPSYMADLWALYFQRFQEILAADHVLPDTTAGPNPAPFPSKAPRDSLLTSGNPRLVSGGKSHPKISTSV